MNNSKKIKINMPSVLLTVLAVFMACCCIFPFLFMLSSSFKPQGQVFEYPIRLIPQHPILSNYRTLFRGIRCLVSGTPTPF
jgi:ABC-type glycerol-3-phosphate transport system permease component